MTDKEIEQLNTEYKEYESKDRHALPFIIWLKYKKHIKPSEYYKE